MHYHQNQPRSGLNPTLQIELRLNGPPKAVNIPLAARPVLVACVAVAVCCLCCCARCCGLCLWLYVVAPAIAAASAFAATVTCCIWQLQLARLPLFWLKSQRSLRFVPLTAPPSSAFKSAIAACCVAIAAVCGCFCSGKLRSIAKPFHNSLRFCKSCSLPAYCGLCKVSALNADCAAMFLLFLECLVPMRHKFSRCLYSATNKNSIA